MSPAFAPARCSECLAFRTICKSQKNRKRYFGSEDRHGGSRAFFVQNAMQLKNGRRSCRPFLSDKFSLLGAIDGFLQFGPCRELRNFAGRDLDRCPRLRVTSVAGFSLGYRERPETDQRHPVSFFQSSSNAVHRCIDRRSCLGLIDMAPRRDPVDEISFVHRLSWQVSLFLARTGRGAPAEWETCATI